MCWACEHPGSTYQDQLDHMRALMLEHGWAVQGVEGDRRRPPYAYTLGLTDCGLPELVVTGMSLSRAASLLNRVAEHVVHADPPAPGERIPLVGGPVVEIVAVAQPDAHLDTAVAFFGARLRALQLVWADDRGRWPWHPGFRGRRGGQPVLGAPVGDDMIGIAVSRHRRQSAPSSAGTIVSRHRRQPATATFRPRPLGRAWVTSRRRNSPV